MKETEITAKNYSDSQLLSDTFLGCYVLLRFDNISQES